MGKPPDQQNPKPDIIDQCEGEGGRMLLLVSPDLLTASVRVSRSSATAKFPVDKIVEFVRASKLHLSPIEDARLPELAQNLANGANAVVVAKGRPAEKWKDIDWLIPMGIASLRDYSNDTVDLHEVSHFINVRAGQPLCELPAPPGDGCSVLGQSIAAPPCPFELGDRVGLDPGNPSRVLATHPGCVRFQDGRLSVEQHLEVAGDLDFKVGNIDFFGDVTVHGNVLDGFHIKSAKNVAIDGAVGVATIEAGQNLTIKGGVNGGHKGRLVCGGDLEAHYLHMVSVDCGGDVRVDVECHDSTVVAAGSVMVSRGGIIGGKVVAGTDISAGFLGAEMCVPTLLSAGYQASVDLQVEKSRRNLALAMSLVKNLESALGKSAEQPGASVRFPSQRKTQMIALQSRLTDARASVKQAQTELLAQVGDVTPVGATIFSAKQIFPRVTLVIDSLCEEEVAKDIDGPVRLLLDRDQLIIKPMPGKHTPPK